MKKQKIRPPELSGTESRKQSHVELVVSKQVSHMKISSGFETLRFVHNALPEIALSEVDTSTQFLGKNLDVPGVEEDGQEKIGLEDEENELYSQ